MLGIQLDNQQFYTSTQSVPFLLSPPPTTKAYQN